MPAAALRVALPFPPSREWTAGEQRATPEGQLLEGVYRDSYCACAVGKGEDGELARLLNRTLDELEGRRDVLLDLRAQGATFAFFVTWAPKGDSGETFDADLLGQMAELGIALELNVLP
ncbi:MAG: hypothetical protein J0J06_08495 [Sphingomonas sp.]|uniref:hypothetical protein n=1 Tax=Sphingomonas sp. TaxID=28214 RepID=UPI001AC93422|nr:hypothetical protein [Sphingomonas sp.]MBN8815470.1 hypothetical protein [Sphingomonas sp.]